MKKKRIIDADALKANIFDYAPPEMTWDRSDIEHKIDEMPIIEAISVKWLRSKREELLTKNWEIVDSIDNVLQFWVSEGEILDWINVNDSLPEECEDVLVYAEWESAGIDDASKGEGVKIGWHVDGHWHIDGKCRVVAKYWMPLPELPKEE